MWLRILMKLLHNNCALSQCFDDTFERVLEFGFIFNLHFGLQLKIKEEMQRERERVDLISFKSKLKLVLKDKATEYWDLLRKFTRAQLTKRELDAYARNILVTDENSNIMFLLIFCSCAA